jgi:hypothetical protein
MAQPLAQRPPSEGASIDLTRMSHRVDGLRIMVS